MSELFIYFLGIATGLGLAFILVLEMVRRQLTPKTSSSSKPSLADRMKRVKEITSEQLDMSRQVDGPQKNGLDGRHKNGIIGKMKKLDEEKNDLLRSILLDGHDPELTTIDGTGVITKMKLSEYMVLMGIKMEPKKSPTVGKFTVVKGGKDDSGNNTTH